MDAHAIALYALLKKSSEYYRQQHTSGKHFPVNFMDVGHPHCVIGNGNQYRIADLNFFVRIDGHFKKL